MLTRAKRRNDTNDEFALSEGIGDRRVVKKKTKAQREDASIQSALKAKTNGLKIADVAKMIVAHPHLLKEKIPEEDGFLHIGSLPGEDAVWSVPLNQWKKRQVHLCAKQKGYEIQFEDGEEQLLLKCRTSCPSIDLLNLLKRKVGKIALEERIEGTFIQLWIMREYVDGKSSLILNPIMSILFPHLSPQCSWIQNSHSKTTVYDAEPIYEKLIPKRGKLSKQPDAITTQLKTHQLEAVQWMVDRENLEPEIKAPHCCWFLLKNESRKTFYFQPFTGEIATKPVYIDKPTLRGGLLADEMGLGKTLEVLSCIATNPSTIKKPKKSHWKVKEGECMRCSGDATDGHDTGLCEDCLDFSSGPVVDARATLVICPLSILHQWSSEIKKHVEENSMRVHVYEGIAKGTVTPEQLAECDIVLSTYETLCADLDRRENRNGSKRHKKQVTYLTTPLTMVNWHRIILDECQMIESTTAKASQMALSLPCVYKWCVSGTPIQRGLRDLYGLFLFLELQPFDDKTNWVNSVECLLLHEGEESRKAGEERLINALRPILWRNNKKTIQKEIDIPPQSHTVIRVELSVPERVSYERLRGSLSRGADIQSLRSCCVHFSIGKNGKGNGIDPRDFNLNSFIEETKTLSDRLFRLEHRMANVLVSADDCEEARQIYCDALVRMRTMEELSITVSDVTKYTLLLNLSRVVERSDDGRAVCYRGEELSATQLKNEAQSILSEKIGRSFEDLDERIEMFLEEFPFNGIEEPHEWKANKDFHHFIGTCRYLRAKAAMEAIATIPTDVSIRVHLDCPSCHRNQDTDDLEKMCPACRAARLMTDEKEGKLSKEMRKLKTESRPNEDGHLFISNYRKAQKILRVFLKSSDDVGIEEKEGGVTMQEMKNMAHQLKSHIEKNLAYVEWFNESISDRREDEEMMSSSKLDAVKREIERIHREEPKAKMVVFSEFPAALLFLHQILKFETVLIRAKKVTEKQINQFLKNTSCSAILMPFAAGANGLNLIEATYVLSIEPSTRPGVELQAFNRVHRIGQTKETKVVRFVTAETLEELKDKKKKRKNKWKREVRSDLQDVESDCLSDVDEMREKGLDLDDFMKLKPRELLRTVQPEWKRGEVKEEGESMFQVPLKKGTLEYGMARWVLQIVLERFPIPGREWNRALRVCKSWHLIVTDIMQEKQCHPGMYDGFYVLYNTLHDRKRVMQDMMQDVRISAKQCQKALQFACMEGSYQVLRVLLKNERLPLQMNHELFAIMSSSDRHYKCVKLLLQDKRMDPLLSLPEMLDRDNYLFRFIRMAAWDIVSLFARDERVVFHTGWFNRNAQAQSKVLSLVPNERICSLLGFNGWNTR
ncbi:hypothetical protein PROFUN_14201 [Planoprotostelium fungivorum]|uniref:Uncharacterized protein n=1 Tax=Planoprotostelium fungivorum TaxID=1890364 RepID=A0A2P6N378_9EUKA|nr:hypothetical protein PROFUN_14201 [Planoprotostelium fungivorum]